jgi:hypothetical protein
MVNWSAAPAVGVLLAAVIRKALCVAAVGEKIGAAPPVAAAVNVGLLDDAVSCFELSAMCATSAGEPVAVPELKVMLVPVPNAVPATVAAEPSAPADRPPKVIVLLPV